MLLYYNLQIQTFLALAAQDLQYLAFRGLVFVRPGGNADQNLVAIAGFDFPRRPYIDGIYLAGIIGMT
jgi:hypothetical protein